MNKPEADRQYLMLFEKALAYLNNNKIPPVSLVKEITKLKLKLK